MRSGVLSIEEEDNDEELSVSELPSLEEDGEEIEDSASGRSSLEPSKVGNKAHEESDKALNEANNKLFFGFMKFPLLADHREHLRLF